MRLRVPCASIQDAKPDYPYGPLAHLPIQKDHEAVVLRVGIPPDIPSDAIVTAADLVLTTHGAYSGTRTFSLRGLVDGWKLSKVTWENQPSTAGSTVTQAVGAVAGGTAFSMDVTAHAQAWIAGTATNHGWLLTSSSATEVKIRGPRAEVGQPYVDLTYVEPGDPPWDLTPDGGAVSVAKPTLQFATAGDVTAIRVQIDATTDFTSPDFDSGVVAAVAGELDLSTTAFAGLSDGATVYWQAAYLGETGVWSDYSETATFSRDDLPTATITSPGSTSADKTPPITWTAPGQAAWRVLLYRPDGTLVDESGKTAGTDTDWTPSKGLRRVGEAGHVVLHVWDDVARVATPGAPTYAEDTQDFTLTTLDDAEVDTLTASAVGRSPAVHLVWTGAAADYWQPTRDGDWLDKIGDGTLLETVDYTASPKTEHTYQVLVGVDGDGVSHNGPSATFTPRSDAVWLMDPDTGLMVAVLGDGTPADPSMSMADQSVVHEIVGKAPVRRVAGMPPPFGSVEGNIMDALGLTGAQQRDALLAFKVGDPYHVYRLVFGDFNLPVTIGDISVAPQPASDEEFCYTVAFNWWQTSDELLWES